MRLIFRPASAALLALLTLGAPSSSSALPLPRGVTPFENVSTLEDLITYCSLACHEACEHLPMLYVRVHWCRSTPRPGEAVDPPHGPSVPATVTTSIPLPSSACGNAASHQQLLDNSRAEFASLCTSPQPGRDDAFFRAIRLSSGENPTMEEFEGINASEEPWSALSTRIASVRSASGSQRQRRLNQLFDAATRRVFLNRKNEMIAQFREPQPRQISEGFWVVDGGSFSPESALDATQARARATLDAILALPLAQRPDWAVALRNELEALATRTRRVNELFERIDGAGEHLTHGIRTQLEQRIDELRTGCADPGGCGAGTTGGSMSGLAPLLLDIPPTAPEGASAEIERLFQAANALRQSAEPLHDFLEGHASDHGFHALYEEILAASDCRRVDQNIDEHLAGTRQPSCASYCAREGGTYRSSTRTCTRTESAAHSEGDRGRAGTPDGASGLPNTGARRPD
ncbi:MAG: hypothetical protein IT285_05685 [Bdellovibrionales bacterium]|nr:hypothetical protein [Bdellovibrionales bacterium]